MVDWTTRKDGTLVVKCVDNSDKRAFLVHCKYIFACDGASSKIRQKCQLKFEDMTTDSVTRSVCFEITSSHAWFNSIDSQYMHVVSREDHKRRVVFVPLGQNRQKISMAKVTPDQEADMDKLFTEVEHRSGLKLGASDCHHLSFYNTRSSISETFYNKDGNVFLVGDSAHTFLPFGGHGLNEAIADAVKFGKVLKEGGDDLGQRLVDMARNRRVRALEVFTLVQQERVKYYPK